MRRIIIALTTGLMVMASAASAQQPAAQAPKPATAIFAGGCFWCIESDFDKVPGVISTTSGYIGGRTPNPTYQQVSSGGTGHAEAVEIVFDPAKVSYEKLLDVFWHSVDPLTKDAQFCDHGDQYRSAIFYLGNAQRQQAEKSKAAVQARFKEPVQTEIAAAGTFYKAEDYHQDYHNEESDPLQVLSLQLRPRRAAAAALGQGGVR